MQREDFKGLFKAMSPYPVTIRLLDISFYFIMPTQRQLIEDLENLYHLRQSVSGMEILAGTMALLHSPEEARKEAEEMRGYIELHVVEAAIAKKETMLQKVRVLYETNPMLGHRGVRLGITFPEIYAMQIRAVLEATAECAKEGIEIHPQVMVPQVCTAEELKHVKRSADIIRKDVEAAVGKEVEFHFGTMIEVVRACMRADSLAEEADFFSFGTNDLTQATFSFSREDAENKFLPMYNENGILQDNPFEVLDVKGVGKLMELAVKWGREVRPDLKVGICGEHGGHPASIKFCQEAGLNYVSCSAPRVPVARLAAAHAALMK